MRHIERNGSIYVLCQKLPRDKILASDNQIRSAAANHTRCGVEVTTTDKRVVKDFKQDLWCEVKNSVGCPWPLINQVKCSYNLSKNGLDRSDQSSAQLRLRLRWNLGKSCDTSLVFELKWCIVLVKIVYKIDMMSEIIIWYIFREKSSPELILLTCSTALDEVCPAGKVTWLWLSTGELRQTGRTWDLPKIGKPGWAFVNSYYPNTLT